MRCPRHRLHDWRENGLIVPLSPSHKMKRNLDLPTAQARRSLCPLQCSFRHTCHTSNPLLRNPQPATPTLQQRISRMQFNAEICRTPLLLARRLPVAWKRYRKRPGYAIGREKCCSGVPVCFWNRTPSVLSVGRHMLSRGQILLLETPANFI